MYLLISVSILAASLNSVLLHTQKESNVFSFNFFCSLIWIILLGLFSGGLPSLNREAFVWGIVYAAVQVLFLIFKTKAMSSGSVSVTTLIGNLSLLLSTGASVLLWHEKISAPQALGIGLLILSVFICTNSKPAAKSEGVWKIYCILFFISAAAVGIVFKCFSKSGEGDTAAGMMLISSIVMSVLFLLLSVFTRKSTKKPAAGFKYVFTVISCGALSCLYNRLNITLSGSLPGAVFFPAFNGGVIVVSSLLGKFFLHERLAPKEISGLILGTISIIVIGVF